MEKIEVHIPDEYKQQIPRILVEIADTLEAVFPGMNFELKN